ncbi:unnamed protein product [Trifolium pratense]|uniref:Uncharacterized protein n=1 Tax=Trifolium pratense TaxID=57577 RepID=A0ACB0LGL4_TRIPR|nr:unnamed protein product [Trifolium pratense]
MDRTIKLAPAVILFVFIFFVTEVASTPTFVFTGTSLKCTSTENCLDDVILPDVGIPLCLYGYCVKVTLNPNYLRKHHM